MIESHGNWASHSLGVLKMFQKIHVPALWCLQRKASKQSVIWKFPEDRGVQDSHWHWHGWNEFEEFGGSGHQHWEPWSNTGIFCWSQSSQTPRAEGTNPSHEPDPWLILVENIIYQLFLVFLASELCWYILRHQSSCVFKSHRAGAELALLFLDACLY